MAWLTAAFGPDWWLVPAGFISLFAGLGLARWLAPPGGSVRMRWASALFATYLVSWAISIVLPWVAMRAYFAAFAKLAFALMLARLAFVVMFDGLLARRRQEVPRIGRDIAQGVAFFVAALGALHSAGVEPGQLLATSALLTVVAGMALQETLGNLVAGLALQAERPFRVGDWIEIHGPTPQIGRVREINWRATRLYTLDNVDLVVPNAAFAKASFTNHDHLGAPRRSVYFTAPMNVPPLDVHAAVLPALKSAPGVLATPEPSIVTFAFDDRGIQFWVRYFIADMGRRDQIDGAVRDRIWYALTRASIPITIPVRKVELLNVDEDNEAKRKALAYQRRTKALKGIELFAQLKLTDFDVLAAGTSEALYTPGEVVIRQGDAGREMYIVEEGELAIRILTDKGEIEAARIKAGSFFGEMSLLTGDTRSATVVALERCRLLVINQPSFKALLERHPHVAKTVSEKIIERRLSLDAAPSIPSLLPTDPAHDTADLVDKIRNFFGLGD